MLLIDVLEMISIHNKVYYLQYSESFTGDVFMTTDNEPGALNKLFLHSQLNCQYCLFTIDYNTVQLLYSRFLEKF